MSSSEAVSCWRLICLIRSERWREEKHPARSAHPPHCPAACLPFCLGLRRHQARSACPLSHWLRCGGRRRLKGLWAAGACRAVEAGWQVPCSPPGGSCMADGPAWYTSRAVAPSSPPSSGKYRHPSVPASQVRKHARLQQVRAIFVWVSSPPGLRHGQVERGTIRAVEVFGHFMSNLTSSRIKAADFEIPPVTDKSNSSLK